MKNQKPRKIFIEDDEELREDEFRTALRRCYLLTPKDERPAKDDEFFDQVLTNALMNSQEVWAAIKQADEIYASTALIPLMGFGSSMGSGMLFNNMMYQAIKENVVGKKVFIIREFKDVMWEELEAELVEQTFGPGKNELYTLNSDLVWEQVNIEELLKNIS
jgi:hypothetical protein